MGYNRSIEYSMWIGVLKAEAVGKRYNIPWGDVSSAVSVLTTRSLVVVLDNDPHSKYIVEIVKELKKKHRDSKDKLSQQAPSQVKSIQYKNTTKILEQVSKKLTQN